MLWERWGTGGYNLVLIQVRKAAREAEVCWRRHCCCSGGGGGGSGEGGGSSSVSSSVQCKLKYGHQNCTTRRFKYFQFLDNTVISLNWNITVNPTVGRPENPCAWKLKVNIFYQRICLEILTEATIWPRVNLGSFSILCRSVHQRTTTLQFTGLQMK